MNVQRCCLRAILRATDKMYISHVLADGFWDCIMAQLFKVLLPKWTLFYVVDCNCLIRKPHISFQYKYTATLVLRDSLLIV